MRVATIERRGDGWRVRWRDEDGTSRSRQCPTARSERDLKLEVEETVARGRRWEPVAAARSALLRDLIEAYALDLRRTHRPRTVVRAVAALAPFLAWAQGHAGLVAVGVDVLTRANVATHDAYLVQRQLSVASRRTFAWAIGACWRWGWEHPDWRQGLAEPSMPRMPAVVLARVQAATWEQLDAVVDAAAEQAVRMPGREWVRRAVLLMRGTGWRISQVLGLQGDDVSLACGTITLRPELGKSANERRGRTVPLAPWLRDELATWGRREGPLVGHAPDQRTASTLVRDLWRRTPAPVAIYAQRPDHAFRIAVVSGLTRARVDHEAVEFYVGHAAGIRGHYVDPEALPLAEVANAIPCVRSVSALKVRSLDQARAKRSAG